MSRLTIRPQGSGDIVYRLSTDSFAEGGFQWHGRVLSFPVLTDTFSVTGRAPFSGNVSIDNSDSFIDKSLLWNAEAVLSAGGMTIKGNVASWSEEGGKLVLSITEKNLPEFSAEIPDEMQRIFSADPHWSAVDVAIPIAVGGSQETPLAVKGVFSRAVDRLYILCSGEIHEILEVRLNGEMLTPAECQEKGIELFTGTSSQEVAPGFACVRLPEDLLRNDDGTFAEVGAKIVGLKLGNHTPEECRSAARFLYHLLKTPATGVGGWGLGIPEEEIDASSFYDTAILLEAKGLKFDAVLYFRQTGQSWIDQICQASMSEYFIAPDGHRSLRAAFGKSSKALFTDDTASTPILSKDSVINIRNCGSFYYDYSYITDAWMGCASWQNLSSIQEVGRQEFRGESYLVKDAHTAESLLACECKRTLVAAEKLSFSTDSLYEGARAGDLVTLDFERAGISGLFKIISLRAGDFEAAVIAERYDPLAYSVEGETFSGFDLLESPEVRAAVLPAKPEGLELSSEIIDTPSGSHVRITGSFQTAPGAFAVLCEVGKGATPSSWQTLPLQAGGGFIYEPADPGQLYTFRICSVASGGKSSWSQASCTAIADTEAPLPPVVTGKVAGKTVALTVKLSSPPSDMRGFEIWRATSASMEGAVKLGEVYGPDGEAPFMDVSPAYGVYFYAAKSFDRWGNVSGFGTTAELETKPLEESDVAMTLAQMPGGSVFSLGLKGCTTESIKEVGGIKDVSGCGNHGQAFGAVEVVTDPQEGQVLHITGSGYCQIPGDMLVGDARSFKVRFKVGANAPSWFAIFAQGPDRYLSASGRIGILYDLSNQRLALCVGDGTNYNVCCYGNIDEGWHTTIFTVSLKDGVIETWLDGIKVAEISLTLTAILQGGEVFLGARPSTNADLYVSHGSVYNYKLSPAQIKSLFMFPSEALFAQLGADIITANSIGAKHLVKTEALITEEAQISTGLFDKIVVGSSSYQATKTTATNAQNKANAAQAAADLAEKRYTYEIDLRGSQYDPNIYYPMTFSLDTDKIKIYTVKAPIYFWGVPWSTHPNPNYKHISAEVSISAIGRAWGGNPDVNYLRLFNYRFCTKPPIYAMAQCTYNSKSVFFLRGGAGYVLDTPVQCVPQVYTELTNIHTSASPWRVAPVADPSSITAQRTDNTSVVLKIFDEKYVNDWVTPGTTTINGGSVTTGTVTALQLAALCVTAAKIAAEAVTTAKLAANAVTTAKLATDAIKSLNYIAPASGGTFAQDGSFLDLANGSFNSKGFNIDSSGNAYFAGDITGSSGTFHGSLKVGATTYAPGIVLSGNPIYIDLGIYYSSGISVGGTVSHYLKIVFDGGSFSLDIWVGRSWGRGGNGIRGLDVVARGHVGGSGGLLTVEAINNVTDKRCYLKISNYQGKGYDGNYYISSPCVAQLSGPDITPLTTAPSGTMQVIEKREIAGEAVVALEGGIIWSTVGGNQSYRNSGTLVLKLNNGKMIMIGMWPYGGVKAVIMTFPVPFKNATYSILAYHAQAHLYDLEFSEKTTSSIRVATRDNLWLGGVIWFAYGDY